MTLATSSDDSSGLLDRCRSDSGLVEMPRLPGQASDVKRVRVSGAGEERWYLTGIEGFHFT